MLTHQEGGERSWSAAVVTSLLGVCDQGLVTEKPGTLWAPGPSERETGFEPATTGLGSRHSTS